MGASPGAAVALTRMNAEIDVRPILSSIRVPSLILHRKGDRCIKVEEGRFLSQRIPGAKYVELPGEDHLPFVGDQEEIVNEIEKFLSEIQEAKEPDRVLATLLFARFNDNSDSRKSYTDILRREVAKFRGREIDHEEEKYLAAFDGPARAIRSACILSTLAKGLNLDIQIGVHTGECDAIGDRLEGVAVQTAAEIAAKATSGEVLVSRTVKDLVAGSGIVFDDRGSHAFPGDEEKQLFAARF
jgi:hypothetical protein